ncbi:MAG: hypothetical protein A3F68_01640 [Acidobacteria bacterium RIFCSPLOWO2_12_FULL_54_10]|nr:MAG: hypothetical protein A3F68_01640 [Acidobacteria bacterium RIFCSPLOWO2_12_FULL_54_10]
MPNDYELACYYDEMYYGKNRKKFLTPIQIMVTAMTKSKWGKIQRLMVSGGRFLDIGCGRGTLVQKARAEGYEAYGIERNASPQHTEPHIFYKDLSECAFPDNHFQTIILFHVLEHLREPVETLREIRRILQPGGWLFLAVPNFGGAQARASGRDWFHLDLPRHLWHFNKRSLAKLLEQNGFHVQRTSTYSFEYDWYGTLQSWMNRAMGDENLLYAILKGERRFSAVGKIMRLAVASLLALPALINSIWDAARGEGGTLSMMAKKKELDALKR